MEKETNTKTGKAPVKPPQTIRTPEEMERWATRDDLVFNTAKIEYTDPNTGNQEIIEMPIRTISGKHQIILNAKHFDIGDVDIAKMKVDGASDDEIRDVLVSALKVKEDDELDYWMDLIAFITGWKRQTVENVFANKGAPFCNRLMEVALSKMPKLPEAEEIEIAKNSDGEDLTATS